MSERPSEDKKPDESLSAKEAYNAVTDTVTGANVRWRDNLFQAVFILVAVLVGAGVGWLVTAQQPMGVLAGLLAGLIGGTLLSGGFLMVYRAVRHARGKHD